MLCVLTAIAGGTRIFKNKTAHVVENNLDVTDYESVCMAIDCLDSQLSVALEEDENMEFANMAAEINDLRAQAKEAHMNGKINCEEFFNAVDMLQSKMY